ncbi:MAG: DUF2721 domain-containing protein [Proteobacteria bacterium]|nr:DUF2721 domain-containing protein [Pseudomonadota bacterium]
MGDVTPNTVELVQIMQASIAPVTLISGVGLLILSMTNRYGRAIDRTRELLKAIEGESVGEGEGAGPAVADVHHVDHHFKRQIRILYTRALLMRWAIGAEIGSIFSTGLTIFLIYVHLAFGNNLSAFAQTSFITALVLLIVGMGLYLVDMRLSLKALHLEIRAVDPDLI